MRIRTANRNHRRAIERAKPSLEEKIYEWQCGLIHRMELKAGKQIHSNLGWAVVDLDDRIEVCSKIYGYGRVTSTGYYETGRMEHDIEIFEYEDEEDFE